MRRRKVEREALVDRGAVRGNEASERRVPWLRNRAGDGARDRSGEAPRNADDTDAPASRGGGDGGDRLAARRQRRAFAFASASSVRLMCHCCTIDSRFCTTQYSTRPAGK